MEYTINPFGVGGSLPEGYPIVNDLTTGGADKALSADMGKKLSNSTIKTFSLCTYNVGHWALGKDYKSWIKDTYEDLDYDNYTYNRSTGTGTPPYANYAAQRERWRKMLNDYSPDVIMTCEYSDVFAKVNNADVYADTEVFGQYPFKRIGNKVSDTSYMWTAAFSRIPLGTSTCTSYAQTVQAGRYYQQMDIELCGKKVTLVVTHLEIGWGTGNTGQAARVAEITQLINAFGQKDYVVICGDFNNNSTEMNPFTEAGFAMANVNGYLGRILTCPSTGTEQWKGGSVTPNAQPDSSFDNIITRGFAISNIRTIDRKDLTDHMGFMCDLTMID